MPPKIIAMRAWLLQSNPHRGDNFFLAMVEDQELVQRCSGELGLEVQPGIRRPHESSCWVEATAARTAGGELWAHVTVESIQGLIDKGRLILAASHAMTAAG